MATRLLPALLCALAWGCSGLIGIDDKVFVLPDDGGTDTDVDTDVDSDSDTDADTDGDSDTDTDTGTGPDPCEGVSCDSPPADECLDSQTLRDYLDEGYCEDGYCYYTFADIPCADGCEFGACTGCGNGVRQTGEECDDGNDQDGDGCSGDCVFEYCGDELTGSLTPVGDDFESGDLLQLPWELGAIHRLDISTVEVYGGEFAVGSTNAGVIDSVAWLALELHMGGQICFWYAGESEACCDAFRFNADSTVVFEQMGDHKVWTQYCHQVAEPGLHTFTWSYEKDDTVDVGWDAYYVDDVVLVAEAYDEECDDGNNLDGDGCSSDCLLE